jgi:carbon storage regulator
MLVLTRKLMERLYIGDDICITVVRLEGGQVRLGIDAPKHIPVVRGELTGRDRDPGRGGYRPGRQPEPPSAMRLAPIGPRETGNPPPEPSR